MNSSLDEEPTQPPTQISQVLSVGKAWGAVFHGRVGWERGAHTRGSEARSRVPGLEESGVRLSLLPTEFCVCGPGGQRKQQG